MAKKVTKKSAKKTTKKASSRSSAGMGKNLVIVESAAKAKTINRYLGSDYVVKASVGHVRDLPKREIGVDVEHDFVPTYEPLDGRKRVLTELKKYAAKAPMVYLATDLDREGEAIAWHLAEALGLSEERTRRVVFNEITASAIREAFEHPRTVDMDRVNAQQARRILDRIVGYELSPLLWKKVTPGISAGRVQSVAVRLIVEREREIEAFMPEEFWSIGGIFTTDAAQIAPLGESWRSFLGAKDDKGNGPTKDKQIAFLGEHNLIQAELMDINGEKFRPGNVDEALEIAKALGMTVADIQRVDDPAGKGPAANKVTVLGSVGPDAPQVTVGDLSHRSSQSRPQAPFTTASMQQAASVRLHFSVSKTMRTAQGLYEGVDLPGEGTTGLITYMRTDSQHLSAEAVATARTLIGDSYGERYLPEKPNVYAAGGRAQEAHEAIRPTDPTRLPKDLKDSLTPDQFKLYDLIWRQFVACQMTPAQWTITEAKLHAQCSAGQATFRAVGRTLEFDGFMKVAGQPKSKEPLLPPLEMGQQVHPVDLAPTQHFTQGPPRYTEASLIKVLKAEGIGRPSTYGAIIQTIQDRKYAELENRAFAPTDLGIVVTDKLVKHFPDILNVQFTAKMEDDLDGVAEAQTDWVELLRAFYGPFHKDIERASEEMVHAKAETTPTDYDCPTCGKKLHYRFGKNGRYLGCEAYPECDYTCPIDKDGKPLERKEIDIPCPECNSPMMLRRSRWGTFLGCTKYPDCKGTRPCDDEGNPLKVVKPEEVHETCPDCGAPMEVKFKGRRAFLGCSTYPACKCTAPIPDGIAVEQPPKPEPKDAGVGCNKCGRPMLIRVGPRGEFLACSGFPKCRNAMNLDKLDELKAMAERGEIPEFTGKDKKAAKKTTKKAGKKTSKKAAKKTTKKAAKEADSNKDAASESDAGQE